MIPSEFDYESPATIDEALSLLASVDEREVKVLAGGQSLLPVLRLRLAAPELVVDLGRIEELRGVRDEGDAIVIGAMTTTMTSPASRSSASMRCCCPRPPRPSPTTRSATAARSVAPWCTPTPRAT